MELLNTNMIGELKRNNDDTMSSNSRNQLVERKVERSRWEAMSERPMDPDTISTEMRPSIRTHRSDLKNDSYFITSLK
jgi:hypothetical protein